MLIAKPGTPYEAVVTPEGSGVMIEITSEDDTASVSLYRAYLNQNGLAYPPNLLAAEGGHRVGEPTPLDLTLAQVVFAVMKPLGQEVPIKGGNPFSKMAADLAEAPLGRGIQFSAPSFGMVVRPNLLPNPEEVAKMVRARLLPSVQSNQLSSLRLIPGRAEPVEDVSPQEQLERLGRAAEWQDERGRVKGFFLEQLAAYPNLQRLFLDVLEHYWARNTPPMDPGVMSAAEAFASLELGDFSIVALVEDAFDDPALFQTLDDIAAQVGSTQEQNWAAPFHVVEAFAEAESGSLRNLLRAPVRLAEDQLRAAGAGALVDAVKATFVEILEQALPTLLEYPAVELFPEARVLEQVRWDRGDAVGISQWLYNLLSPQGQADAAALWSLTQEAEEAEKTAKELARRRRSLRSAGMAYWVMPDSGDPARSIGRSDRDEFVRDVLLRDEDFFLAAYESDEFTEWSMMGVEERPSEQLLNGTLTVEEDLKDLDLDEIAEFAERLDESIEDTEDFDRFLDRIPKELAAEYTEWRVDRMREEEDSDGIYEPDTESFDAQVKANEIASEIAEAKAFADGWVFVDLEHQEDHWSAPTSTPLPVIVHIEAALPLSALRSLVHEIVRANYERPSAANDFDPQNGLDREDIIDIDASDGVHRTTVGDVLSGRF